MENMKIPQEWMALFKAANSIRPCSFDPTPFLRPGDVVEGRAPSVHLPLDAKRVWFHTYCNEQGVKGYILCGEPKINFDLTHSNGAKVGFVTCDCNIVIDDVVVANACAGLAVFVDNITDLSMAIQNCSGTAQSRALSNAGFGAVSGTELVTNDNPNAELPFTMGGESKADTDSGDTKPENKPAPVASNNNGATTTPSDPTAAAPDELAQAKATVCRIRSRDEGKTFGEILASPNGPWRIHYYMTSTRMGETNDIARAACKVIWDSLDPAIKAAVSGR